MGKVGYILLAIFFLGIGFILTDCSAGRTRYFETSVLNHDYKEAWTETTMSTDSDGNVTWNTIRHPEEFHLICQELKGIEVFDVNTSRSMYYSFTNGQYATVKTREGKWTKSKYLPNIVD